MKSPVTLKIEFTPQQGEQTRQAIVKGAPAMKLTLEPLEDRVAPVSGHPGGINACLCDGSVRF